MAKLNVSGLEETIKWMEQMDELTGEMADEMLMAGAEKVREAWQTAATLHNHRVTDDMYNSIGYGRKPQNIDHVKTIEIYPRGKDRKGVRNMEKAAILNHGARSNPGSRWVEEAEEESEETATPAMLSVFEEWMRKWGA